MSDKTRQKLVEQVGDLAYLYGQRLIGLAADDGRLPDLERVQAYVLLLDAYRDLTEHSGGGSGGPSVITFGEVKVKSGDEPQKPKDSDTGELAA